MSVAHQTVESAELAHVIFATTTLANDSAAASTLKQILSLALEGGYATLISVMPKVIAAITVYSPVLGVISSALLPALQQILAELVAPVVAPPAK